MEDLIKALKDEVNYPVDEDVIKWFLNYGELRHYPRDCFIIEPGEVDDHLFLIVEGIFKLSWMEGEKEVIGGFGGKGTMLLSPMAFYNKEPSHYYFKTCKECKIMAWKRTIVMDLMEQSHPLCKWLFYVAMAQYYATEKKMSTVLGSAREKYNIISEGGLKRHWSHIANRPDLTREVSSKDLASYLDITPSYLSNLRKESIKERRTKKSEDVLPKPTMPIRQELPKDSKRAIVEMLTEEPQMTIQELSKRLRLSVRTIKQYLSDLKTVGQIVREGNNRSGYWRVVKK